MISPDRPELAVELDSVTKRFGRVVAVEGLSLKVPRGSVFGLIGPNGAGKSTTLKMLMGLLSPTSGRARVLGLDVRSQITGVKERTGYVPEVPTVYRWMRVGEALRFTRSFYPRWNEELCSKLLDLFSLDVKKKVRHLSKGTAAKLSLLLAVAHDPELLILDEPMSGLDPLVREEFLEGVLRTMCEGDRTVIFSSHTIDDVQRLADSVGILHQGKLLVHRRLEDILQGARRIQAVIRDGASPLTPPPGTIWQRVDRREWILTVADFSERTLHELEAANPIERVEVASLSLEDIFKDYVKGRRIPA